ncbi:MAG: arylsulfatase [Bacteroidales bacterium]|nr:arylsulfatase [Bacteroidales bacterium]
MRATITLLLAVLIVLPLMHSCNPSGTTPPNILLIMVDDLGFSDFGCYGSEIQTPNIDELAQNGLRFTQFYNTAKCHSSRVSLLTGLYCTQAGDESLARATTIAEVLDSAGYFTSMAGKWHLHKQPTDFGFQSYWGHLSGATDFFNGDNTFRYNGEPWSEFDKDFYTTDANVDFSMEFLDEALESGKPFFHYVAFNAPHYPLQAPRKEVEKYLRVYDPGWDRIRKERYSRQLEMGIFESSLALPPLPDHMTPWDSLSPKQQQFESFRMSVYAGMVDRLDQNIGRLVNYLEEKGVMRNTLIMICSDNGACPFERSRELEIPPWEGGSFLLYDASWATVGNTPLRHYKQTQHEGGISSPLIVHWPGHITNQGEWERSPGHLIDVMATCLEVSGAEYPERKGLQPLQGRSLVPLFSGEEREQHEELYFRFGSCRALRKREWKVVSFYGSQWELYNMDSDRFEQHDLADQHPDIVQELSARWHALAETTDLLEEKDRKPVEEVRASNTHREWHKPQLTEGWDPDY